MAMGPIRALFRWWFPTRLDGPAPPDGPIVVASNHFSHLDPVITGLVVGRPIRYLAVDELYGNSRVFDALTLWFGAIPMPRTRAPLGAMRLALAELGAGGAVGLYPEGVRVWTWGEVEPKAGAAWLALRAGVPLVPVAIAGTDQALGRGARRIDRAPIWGRRCEAILPDDHEGAVHPAGTMMAEWKRRIGAALESMYAEWPP